MSRTPVQVSDALFARLRTYFDEAQLVGLTHLAGPRMDPCLDRRNAGKPICQLI